MSIVALAFACRMRLETTTGFCKSQHVSEAAEVLGVSPWLMREAILGGLAQMADAVGSVSC